MASHSDTCHPAEVTFPPLPQAETGTRLSDPGGMPGWVDLVGWLHTDILWYSPPNDISAVDALNWPMKSAIRSVQKASNGVSPLTGVWRGWFETRHGRYVDHPRRITPRRAVVRSTGGHRRWLWEIIVGASFIFERSAWFLFSTDVGFGPWLSLRTKFQSLVLTLTL